MVGIFDELKELNGRIELTSEEKDLVLKKYDIEKDEAGYYLDAFGKRITYQGIKTLKKPYVNLKLTEFHKRELEVCANDFLYFLRNYCKIVTKNGVDRPEFREYQIDFCKTLLAGKDVVAMLPRQCVAGDTVIQVKEGSRLKFIKIRDLFNGVSKSEVRLFENDDPFIESYYLQKDIYIYSNNGFNKILACRLTKKLDIYRITLEDGKTLEAAGHHVLIDKNYEEVYVENCLGRYIQTVEGYSKVIKKELLRFDYCYDLSLSGNNLYYSNGILSHNSGKSVTTACYLLWNALFKEGIIIGITANVYSLAAEVLDKLKKIFVELPIWMASGIVNWNKGNIEFENKTKVLTAAAGPDSFRGFSCNLILVDETAWINGKDYEAMIDSITPTMAALQFHQLISISTPNGMNHFFHLVQNAKSPNSEFNYFTMDWKEVPRWNLDGTKKDPEEFRKEIISKHGLQHFKQNYELAFLGSSFTLIDSQVLARLKPKPDTEIIYNSLFSGLRIFEDKIENHSYIIGVDPKKDGMDKFAFQVLDVSSIPFKQVASANLKESYVNIAPKLAELGEYFNNALIVYENNIDNAVIDQVFYNYEYEGDIYKEKGKNILGFRTTSKTKRQILSLLKKFLENDKLILYDKDTIDELFVFIEKGKSYEADSGFHDDLVMALSLCLVPFLDIRNFEDLRGFVDYLEMKELLNDEEALETIKFVDLGFTSVISDDDIEEDPLKDFEIGYRDNMDLSPFFGGDEED